MKIIGILLPAVLTAFQFHPLSAQDNQVKLSRFSAREVQIQSGFFMESTIPGSLADFRKLAPESVLLDNDFAGFSQRMYGDTYSYGYSYGLFSMLVGFQLSDKQKTAYKPNPLIRMGITYYVGMPMTNYLYKRTTGIYDTLTSAQTGDIFLIDSTNRQSYYMDFFARHLRFDASFIYRTNPGYRISLFTGAGITAGLTFGSQTSISYSNYTSLKTYSVSETYISYRKSFDSDFYDSETFTNGSQFGFSGYIPLGINFRVAKKHAFWSHMNLFCEMRLGIDVIVIKNIKTLENTTMHHGCGVKFKW